MAVERGNWGHLPDEMLEIFDRHILSRLSNFRLLGVDLVCKDWRRACAQRKMIKTGTCFVKLYLDANVESNSVLNTLQIHNPLRREWYPAEKGIAWTDQNVPERSDWYGVKEGNNGLLYLWKGILTEAPEGPAAAGWVQQHHILVFNPVRPERRRKLPVFEHDSSVLRVVKMVQSEDDAAQEYSILLFFGVQPTGLAIFRSGLGSWKICTAWPELADPLQRIVSIMRSCSGGRLYCLFQRGHTTKPWDIQSCSIWRFDLEAEEWVFIARLPKRVLKRARQTLKVTLVGCGDRVLAVVTASGQVHPIPVCASTEGNAEMAEEDETEDSDDLQAEPSSSGDGIRISLVEIWECVGRDSTTEKARWLCLSQMPAWHVGLMRQAKFDPGQAEEDFNPGQAGEDFTILDAEGCIYFCSDARGRCNSLVLFDCIERSWHMLDRCPDSERVACHRFPYIELLTLQPNKDAIP